jgi:hypothetical protein
MMKNVPSEKYSSKVEEESASGTRIVYYGRCGSVEDRLNISPGTEREDSPVE